MQHMIYTEAPTTYLNYIFDQRFMLNGFVKDFYRFMKVLI